MNIITKGIFLASAMTLISAPVFAAGQDVDHDDGVSASPGSSVSGDLTTNVEAGSIGQNNESSKNSSNKIDLGGASGNSDVSGSVTTNITIENEIEQKNEFTHNSKNKMAIGTVKNSSVSGSVSTSVNAARISQLNHGSRNNVNSMKIGVVDKSKVSGTVMTSVDVRDGITQRNAHGHDNSNALNIGNVTE